MATLITSSVPFSIASDSAFRAWVSAVINALATVNPSILYQTDDTGQLDPATITVPAGTSTMAGYVIFKFDDGLAPIYLKLYFGKGSTSSTPFMGIVVSSGTDGAGNSTGTMFSPAAISGSTSGNSLPIYVCAIQGFLAINIAANGSRTPGTNLFAIAVSRSADESGNPTEVGVHGLLCTFADGLTFWCSSYGGASRFSQTNSSYVTVVSVYNQTSLAFAGKVKPMPIYALAPDVQVAFGMCGLRTSDVALNSEFKVAMVGATPRNFKDIGFSESSIAYPVIWE